LFENRFIASALFLKLHLPLWDSLCEVIWRIVFARRLLLIL